MDDVTTQVYSVRNIIKNLKDRSVDAIYVSGALKL
jgi:hypothetical protein